VGCNALKNKHESCISYPDPTAYCVIVPFHSVAMVVGVGKGRGSVAVRFQVARAKYFAFDTNISKNVNIREVRP
jgi:hypothetical protein